MSRLWGHLGTILSAVAAALADFHVVGTAHVVQGALTGITGLLVACHIVTGATAKRYEGDALAMWHRVMDAIRAVHKAVTAQAPAATPATPGAPAAPAPVSAPRPLA
jgi:hypothetical protein